MSSEELTRRLKEELICSICLDCFHDPVSIHCGHTFCQACITGYWDFINKKCFHCPKCRAISRKKILKRNRELGNIAKIVPKLGEKPKGEKKVKEKVCQRHQEPLKLFCKNDQMAICVVCDKSKEHKDHTVFPLEQEFQDQLSFLKKNREKLVQFQSVNSARNKGALSTIDAGIQKMSLAFKQIYQSLKEQKQLFLAQWHSLQTAVKEPNATIAEEISCLDSLIVVAEERWPILELEFLQEMQTASMRLKQKVSWGLDDLPEMEKRIAYQNEVVTRTLRKFEDALISVKKENSNSAIAKKRKSEDQTADYGPESRMHSSSSHQPDKRAPVGDNDLTSVKKEDLNSPIAKQRKLEDQTADEAFDYSPESRKCQKSIQCPLS